MMNRDNKSGIDRMKEERRERRIRTMLESE
jgi:hypothetical protein